MSEKLDVISLFEIVGDGYCTASEDGDKVYAAITAALRDGRRVRLSFKDVEDLTSAFLNSAVGQLYGTFSEEEIRESLVPPDDASKDQLFLLKRVVDRAKEFFKEPDRFKAATKEALGDDSEDED